VPELGPRQLGVGVRGGAQAAIEHAAWAFVFSASPYTFHGKTMKVASADS